MRLSFTSLSTCNAARLGIVDQLHACNLEVFDGYENHRVLSLG